MRAVWQLLDDFIVYSPYKTSSPCATSVKTCHSCSLRLVKDIGFSAVFVHSNDVIKRFGFFVSALSALLVLEEKAALQYIRIAHSAACQLLNSITTLLHQSIQFL